MTKYVVDLLFDFYGLVNDMYFTSRGFGNRIPRELLEKFYGKIDELINLINKFRIENSIKFNILNEFVSKCVHIYGCGDLVQEICFHVEGGEGGVSETIIKSFDVLNLHFHNILYFPIDLLLDIKTDSIRVLRSEDKDHSKTITFEHKCFVSEIEVSDMLCFKLNYPLSTRFPRVSNMIHYLKVFEKILDFENIATKEKIFNYIIFIPRKIFNQFLKLVKLSDRICFVGENNDKLMFISIYTSHDSEIDLIISKVFEKYTIYMIYPSLDKTMNQYLTNSMVDKVTKLFVKKSLEGKAELKIQLQSTPISKILTITEWTLEEKLIT